MLAKYSESISQFPNNIHLESENNLRRCKKITFFFRRSKTANVYLQAIKCMQETIDKIFFN